MSMLAICWPTISNHFDVVGQHLANIWRTFLTSKPSANGTKMLANMLGNMLTPFAPTFIGWRPTVGYKQYASGSIIEDFMCTVTPPPPLGYQDGGMAL